MSHNDKCPIWGTPATRHSLSRNENTAVYYPYGYKVVSPRVGGKYEIAIGSSNIIGSSAVDNKFKARLTTWVLNQNYFGVEWPVITEDILTSVMLQRSLAVHERADRLLKLIADKSEYLGQAFHFYPTIDSDADEGVFKMLATSESQDKNELTYLLAFLKKSEFLDQTSKENGRSDYVITPSGYAHLASLEVKNQTSHQAFVAMWFDSSMDDAFIKGLGAGIWDAGYEPVIIKNKQHNNKIDDEIIAEIRRSRFLVADFTQGKDGARGGVYYEAGFAHGLNLPVIFTCSKEIMDKGVVHFDTRQYNHIVWRDYDDLRDQLAKRISATIGDGPLKKQKAFDKR